MKRLLSIFGLAVLLILSGCEDDNDSPSSGGSGGGGGGGVPEGKTFTATLNGQSYAATSDLFISGSSTSQSGVWAWTAAGLRTDFTTTEAMLVTIVSLDSTDFHVGSVFNSGNNTLDHYCAGTYTIKANNEQIVAETEEEDIDAATCTITAIDWVENTWSATFAFTAESDGGMVYIVTDGVFSEVPID